MFLRRFTVVVRRSQPSLIHNQKINKLIAPTTRCFSTSNNDNNNFDDITPLLDQQKPLPEILVDPIISSLGYSPTDLVIRLLSSVHELGLPWWSSIVLVTLGARSLLIPLVVTSQKALAGLPAAKPEFEKLQQELLANPDMSPQEKMRYRERTAEIYKRHNISMTRGFIPTLFQLPLFMSFFFGLRRLAVEFPSMKEGGTLWFTDLSAADPTYALPIITSCLFLITLEMGVRRFIWYICKQN